MSCKDCKYSPKTYEEHFMGGSCPDAFTDIAVNCGMFDQSNKNKEKQGGKANCRFCADLIVDGVSLAEHFMIKSMDVFQDFQFHHAKGWRIMSLEDEKGYPLNFCPECGRDLREEATNE